MRLFFWTCSKSTVVRPNLFAPGLGLQPGVFCGFSDRRSYQDHQRAISLLVYPMVIEAGRVALPSDPQDAAILLRPQKIRFPESVRTSTPLSFD